MATQAELFAALPAAERQAAINNFIAANSNNAVAIKEAMDTFGVSNKEVATGFQNIGAVVTPEQVKTAYDEIDRTGMLSTPKPSTPSAATPAQPSGGVPANVKAALESPKLTQDQYNTLAAYFGNDVVLNEASRDPNKPTIKDFVGKRSGYEFAGFLASRGTEQGATGTEQQKFNALVQPYIGQEVKYRVETDNETGQTRYFVDNPATGKETEVFQQADGTFKGGVGNLSGQEQGAMSEGSFNLGISYNFDPETGKATIGSPTIKYQAPQSGLGAFGMILPAALAIALPGAGAAIGSAILGAGASTAAINAVGAAVMGGLTTGAITGDLEKGLIASALAGAGTYGLESGMIGDAFDYLGLGDYKDVFNVKNSTQIANAGDVEAQMGGFYGNTDKAIYNPQTGLTGLADGRVVAEAGNPSGIPAGTYTQEEFLNQLYSSFPNETAGLLSNTSTVGGPNYSVDPNANNLSKFLQEQSTMPGQSMTPGGSTPAPNSLRDYLTELGVVPLAAGGAAASSLLGGASGATGITDTIKDVIKSVTGTGSGAATTGAGTTLQGLLGAGIDYARLNELQNLAQEQGAAARQQATEAGKLANIPFTPYTVTTGAGTTAFGTNAAGQPTAAVTASPEYEALRQQALAQAGQAYGAINPATATQDYYANLQALQAPQQQIAQEQLLSNLGAKGLLGIGRNLPTVGQTGTSAVNPYMQSLLASQRQADLQNAVAAQQYGLQQAQGQAQLAGTLLGQGQGIDTAALQTLTQGAGLGSTATQLNQTGALRQLEATLQGQKLGTAYDLSAMDAQSQAILAAAGAAKGMFGLPTSSGNTSSTNLAQQAVNYLGGIFS